MDVHRCRFVPYPSSAINAVAFSHPYVKGARKNPRPVRLALGRANGDIEIWNPLQGEWHQEYIIHGAKDRSIDGLLWVVEPDEVLPNGKQIFGRVRLFSIGYTTSITEWDLENGRPRRHASGQHGDIWCLAARPAPSPRSKKSKAKGVPASEAASQEPPPRITHLVAGTADGSIVLYSVEDDNLIFQKVMLHSSAKKTQMVSMAFQNTNVAVFGCSDSTIRVFDMRQSAVTRRMTLGSDLQGGSKEIIVWAIKTLNNGDIVSGDSTGEVRIWDGRTYTLTQRLQAHRQDVLSLAVAPDGFAIVSGGMDKRIAQFRKDHLKRWTKTSDRRYHEHDVKAMAVFEQGGQMSVVVSGGPSGVPIVTPLRAAGREYHRTLPHLPQSPPLATANKARFLVSWWERTVHIWKLQSTFEQLFGSDEVDADATKNRKLLKTVVVKGEANITSATINDEGSLLVVSTSLEVKAFHLKHKNPTRPADLTLQQVDIPGTLSTRGATNVLVSPDCRWLVVIREGRKVFISPIQPAKAAGQPSYSIQRPQRLRRLDRKTPKHVLLSSLGRYDRNITHVAFSADGLVLATADIAGYIDSWVCSELRRPEALASQNGDGGEDDDEDDASASSSDDGGESTNVLVDQLGASWVRNPAAALLHKLPSAPVVLSFSTYVSPRDGTQKQAGARGIDDDDDYTLLAVTKSWHVETMHPLRGAPTAWYQHNRNRLPAELTSSIDLAMGAVWQQPRNDSHRLWIYGTSFVFMLDLKQNLPSVPEVAGPLPSEPSGVASQSRKRKRYGPHTGAGSRMKETLQEPHDVLRYDPTKSSDWERLNQEDDVRSAATDEDELMNDLSDEDDGTGELARFRDAQNSGQLTKNDRDSKETQMAWWHTYKYRPILGVVPLNNSRNDDQLEVAIVERPIWDVDLPDRFLEDNDGRDTGMWNGP